MSEGMILVSVPGLALALPGAYLMWSTALDLRHALASRHWPTTRGTVRAKGSHQGSAAHGDSLGFVKYVYSVGGAEYVSARYDFAGRNVGDGAVAALLRHAVGDQVVVRYDPANPARAVLEPGPTPANYWRLALAVATLLAGLVLVAVRFGVPAT